MADPLVGLPAQTARAQKSTEVINFPNNLPGSGRSSPNSIRLHLEHFIPDNFPARQQANAYVKAYSLSIQEYQNIYEETLQNIVTPKATQISTTSLYSHAVWAASELCIKKLTLTQTRYLHACSMLSPSDIPLELLVRGLKMSMGCKLFPPWFLLVSLVPIH